MVLLSLVSLVTIGLDQASKALVLWQIRPAERLSHGSWWSPQPVRSRGLVLRGPVWLAASALAVASTIGIGWVLVSPPPDTTLICIAVALGGAASNFGDKLFRGAIIDFILVWQKSFNLADAAIVAGIAGVLLSVV